jgi:hypothetical protein
MAPKLRKESKARSLVLKRPAAAKLPAASAIKGLAGFRKASANFSGAVDKGVAQQNAALASRASVVAGLDARLVCIDPSTNSDKYYVLQGLEDTKIAEHKPKRYYCYQRWGRTGTGGVCRLQGPMEHKKVEAHLLKVFKAKTGAAWGSLKPGEKAKPGLYWLAIPSEADPHALWEYYVDDGVDHKRKGWYPYDRHAMQQVEELYAEDAANKAGKNPTDKRFVASGKFTYCVDLNKLIQLNTTTGKVRKIRRTMSMTTTRADTLPRPGSSPDMALSTATLGDIPHTGLFRADTAETLPAPWNDAVHNARKFPLASTSSASSVPGLPGKRPARQPPPAPSSMNDMIKIAQRGEVERLPAPSLKSWLSTRSIATSGQKSDLVERIYSILDDPLSID